MDEGFDVVSYLMGLTKGKNDATGIVELTGDDYTFTDDGNGNITIEEANNG